MARAVLLVLAGGFLFLPLPRERVPAIVPPVATSDSAAYSDQDYGAWLAKRIEAHAGKKGGEEKKKGPRHRYVLRRIRPPFGPERARADRDVGPDSEDGKEKPKDRKKEKAGRNRDEEEDLLAWEKVERRKEGKDKDADGRIVSWKYTKSYSARVEGEEVQIRGDLDYTASRPAKDGTRSEKRKVSLEVIYPQTIVLGEAIVIRGSARASIDVEGREPPFVKIVVGTPLGRLPAFATAKLPDPDKDTAREYAVQFSFTLQPVEEKEPEGKPVRYRVLTKGIPFDSIPEDQKKEWEPWRDEKKGKTLSIWPRSALSAPFQAGPWDPAGANQYEFWGDVDYELDVERKLAWKCAPMRLPSIPAVPAAEKFRSEHAGIAREIESLLRAPEVRKNRFDTEEEFQERRRKHREIREERILELDKETRRLETGYFQALFEDYGQVDVGARQRLRLALREEAVCLARACVEGLDETRERSSLIKTAFVKFRERLRGLSNAYARLDRLLWSKPTTDYGRARRFYIRYRDDLEHVMALWDHLCKLDLIRFEVLIWNTRAAGSKELISLQTRMKDVYLDQGWIHLVLGQIKREEGIDAADTYLQAIWSTQKQNESIPWHDDVRKAAAQFLIHNIQWGISVLHSAWAVLQDAVLSLLNKVFPSYIDTLSEKSNKEIWQERERTSLRLRDLNQFRGLTPERIRKIGEGLLGGEPYAPSLEKDRLFHEATSGGLLRFAACFETDASRAYEMEFHIAHRHGKLAWADMRGILDLREMKDPKTGEYEKGFWGALKRAIDPVGFLTLLIKYHVLGKFDDSEAYLAERNAQLQEMWGLLRPLRKVGFNLVRAIAEWPDMDFSTLITLAKTNPYFIEFVQHHRLLSEKRHEAEIETRLRATDDFDEKEELTERLEALRLTSLMSQREPEVERLKQEILDHLAVWNFAGAIETARRLEALVPELRPEGKPTFSEGLKKALAWDQSIEVAIDQLTTIGNFALYSAFFARYFQFQQVAWGKTFRALATREGLRELLHFTLSQTHPLLSLWKGGISVTGYKGIFKTALQLGLLGGVGAVMEISAHLMVERGWDSEIADFLALAMISALHGGVGLLTGTEKSLLWEAAKDLKENRESLKRTVKAEPSRFSKWAAEWLERKAARRRFGGLLRTFYTRTQLQAVVGDALWAAMKKAGGKINSRLRSELVYHELVVRLSVGIVDAPLIRLITKRYERLVKGRKGEKVSPKDQAGYRSQLFDLLPLKTLRRAKERGALPKESEQFCQDARREILQSLWEEFQQKNRHAKEVVEFQCEPVGGETAGSLGRRMVAAITVKEKTPGKIAGEIVRGFHEHCRKAHPLVLESLDAGIRATRMPRVWSRGRTSKESIREIRKNPHGMQATRSFMNAVEHQANLMNPFEGGDSRLVRSSGMRRVENLLYRLGWTFTTKRPPARVKRVLKEFEGARLEPWMGFEIVLDALGELMALNERAGEMLQQGRMEGYHKRHSTLAWGALLGRLLLSEGFVKWINELPPSEIRKEGGFFEAVLRRAREEGRLKPAELRLLEEVIGFQQGRTPREVFRARNGGRRPHNRKAVARLWLEHMRATQEVLLQALPEAFGEFTKTMSEVAKAVREQALEVYREGKEPAARNGLRDLAMERFLSLGNVVDLLSEKAFGEFREKIRRGSSASPEALELLARVEELRTLVHERRRAEVGSPLAYVIVPAVLLPDGHIAVQGVSPKALKALAEAQGKTGQVYEFWYGDEYILSVPEGAILAPGTKGAVMRNGELNLDLLTKYFPHLTKEQWRDVDVWVRHLESPEAVVVCHAPRLEMEHGMPRRKPPPPSTHLTGFADARGTHNVSGKLKRKAREAVKSAEKLDVVDVAGWRGNDRLQSLGEILPELATWSPEAIESFLRDHPRLRMVLDGLVSTYSTINPEGGREFSGWARAPPETLQAVVGKLKQAKKIRVAREHRRKATEFLKTPMPKIIASDANIQKVIGLASQGRDRLAAVMSKVAKELGLDDSPNRYAPRYGARIKRKTVKSVRDAIKEKTARKGYKVIDEMGDLAGGRFNLENDASVRKVIRALIRIYGPEQIVELDPPRGAYPRYHFAVRIPGGMVIEIQVGTRMTTEFLEGRTIPFGPEVLALMKKEARDGLIGESAKRGIPNGEVRADYHEAKYDVLDSIDARKGGRHQYWADRIGLAELNAEYNQLLQLTGNPTRAPPDFKARAKAMSERVGAAIENIAQEDREFFKTIAPKFTK